MKKKTISKKSAPKKSNFFEVNSHKAGVKVSINSIMMGGLFFILTLIWTNGPSKFNIFTLVQLILAIPLLYVSSLAYSKISYSEESGMWDTLGWFTHNIGSVIVLNAVGLMTISLSKGVTLVYFFLLIILMAMYSSINMAYNPKEQNEKIFKFFFFLLVVVIGGIVPLLFGLA